MQLEGQSLRFRGGMVQAHALVFGAASGPSPGISGSSGGSDHPSQDSPELSGRKRRAPEPALASMRHQEERRRQQRLAKTRATAAASR